MNYSMSLKPNEIDLLIKKYQNYQVPSTNYYTLFRAKIKCSALTIYQTKKILIQGKDAFSLYSEICKTLGITIDSSLSKENTKTPIIQLFSSTIGNDEVGCGDFFGPVVVASSYVSEENYLRVKKLGVKDSKELKDNDIITIAKELITFIPYQVTILTNEKYNQAYTIKDMNLNMLKAILHNNVINKLLDKYPYLINTSIVLDDFCGEDKYYSYLQKSSNVVKGIIFEEKAENKYLSVACSSIIARYYFLDYLDKMSTTVGRKILKGASKKVDILAALIIKERGINYLKNIAKLNFKNYNRAINIAKEKG